MSVFLETRQGRRAEARTSPEARDFVRSADGWRVVSGSCGGWIDRCGLTTHSGVVHPDEHVDEVLLVALLEDELGFTVDELHSVYSTGGRIPSSRLRLRERIDARLHALASTGGNMDLFGRITGLNASTIDRALARERKRKA